MRYNGHFESLATPLLLFNREGDCLASSCGPATSQRRRLGGMLLPEIDRQHKLAQMCVRADAALPSRRSTKRWRSGALSMHPPSGNATWSGTLLSC